MQQQRAPVMDAKTQRRWDERVRAHIAAQTTEFSEEQRGVLVQLIVAHRAEWRSADEKLREEIGSLAPTSKFSEASWLASA
jgi:hypothetical protein